MRKNFPIESNVTFLQQRDKARVRCTILFQEGRQTDIPKPAEVTLLLLVGYQGVGILGRQLEEGMKEVVIDGNKVSVRAKVEKIHGFSGHADSDALVNFVSHSQKTLKKVFVAMGEPKSSIFLTQRLRDELDVDAVVVEKRKSYEIEL